MRKSPIRASNTNLWLIVSVESLIDCHAVSDAARTAPFGWSASHAVSLARGRTNCGKLWSLDAAAAYVARGHLTASCRMCGWPINGPPHWNLGSPGRGHHRWLAGHASIALDGVGAEQEDLWNDRSLAQSADRGRASLCLTGRHRAQAQLAGEVRNVALLVASAKNSGHYRQLWAYARDDRPWGGSGPPGVAYVYAPDRKAGRPIAHPCRLQGGILQVDGYGGYRALAERGNVQLAFCWALSAV